MNSLTHVHRHLRHTIATTPRCWQWRSLVAANAALRPTPSFRRAFTERRSSPPEEPPKPKPKSSTALRRAASASLPIRSNPTPTRSDIHPIFTYASAERYLMPSLRTALPAGAQLLHDAWWIPRWTDPVSKKEGEVFVLTGSTGRIGSHVLAQVLASKGVRKVYALSRGDDSGSIRERQRAALVRLGLDEKLVEDERVVFLRAWYVDERLGLKQARYDEIAGSVTTIIHNGARSR